MASLQRQPLERYQRAFVACWAGLGVLLVAVTIAGALRSAPLPPLQYSFVLVSGIPFFALAAAYWRAWPGYRVVVGIAGSLIALYGLALVTLGMEDVGGPKVAIPGALVCFAIGTWSLVLAVTEPPRARAGAG